MALVFDEKLSVSESFALARKVSVQLMGQDSQVNLEARQTLIAVLDNWSSMPAETNEVWSDLVEAAGFYPYLAKDASFLKSGNLAGQIRKESYRSLNLHGKYFHEEQQRLLDIFRAGKNLIVSAPTSFGKSLLIEEMVASREFSNIVVIQPTLALLDETRKKLREYSDYKLILKTSQRPANDKGNIFLFTAERVVEYGEFPVVGLLIVDEFYKLSQGRRDDRAEALNVAIYRMLKEHAPRFYMLGPNIDGISEGFAERYNAVFYKTEYSLVNADYHNIYQEQAENLKDPQFRENLLFGLLDEYSDEQTIIYCSSPEKARELASRYTLHLQERDSKSVNKVSALPVADWLRENIHPGWSFIKCLDRGVGVHDGALPRHVSASIIHAFNRLELNYLFCTSTIIEGVNTSAKNIVIYDKKRGLANIDSFDFANISGRAGRMMVHYTGRIFNFIPEPKRESILIDIPFFEQNEQTSSDILIQLHLEDIKDPGREEYRHIQDLSSDERELFRKNAINIWGQKELLERLRSEVRQNPSNVTWGGYPDYDHLLHTLELAREYLARPSERRQSAKKLAALTNIYAQSKSVMALVRRDMEYKLKNGWLRSEVELVDEAVREMFHFQRHWLNYVIPKWLYVVDSLQQFACAEVGVLPGSYSFYASYIENDFLNPQYAFLAELGIPRTAIEKMAQHLTAVDTEDEVVAQINQNLLDSISLSEYERQKIIEAF